MNTVEEVCQRLALVLPEQPLCIETGTMYTCPPGNEPHNTTSNIMRYIVAPKDGILYSLDIDPEHIEFSKNFCEKYGGRLEHLLGDSIDRMKDLALHLTTTITKNKSQGIKISMLDPVDLLCLDGKEFDEPHMVKEFEAIKDCLAEKHFVLVDDIHNQNSVKYKLMVPILKDLAYSYLEVPTPTGMFVAWKGYDF